MAAIYGQDGRLDYVSPTVAENTDTVTLRGVITNSVYPGMKAGQRGARELVDGEFVTVLLEGVQPITVLAIPRAAVLSDQQGDYVYVVDAQNKAQVRRVQLGQSTPSTAVVTNGLNEGELVISEGLQRVRPGQAVSAEPASPSPAISPPGPRGRAAGASNERVISALFVDRPRLAVVIAVIITLAGLLAMTRIPVAQLPDIVPPQVRFPPSILALRLLSSKPTLRSRSRRRSSASTK